MTSSCKIHFEVIKNCYHGHRTILPLAVLFAIYPTSEYTIATRVVLEVFRFLNTNK